MNTTQTTTDTICGIIREELGLPEGAVVPSTTIRELPELQSVQYLRLIAKIERRFDVELEDDLVFGIATVEDLGRAVDGLRVGGSSVEGSR